MHRFPRTSALALLCLVTPVGPSLLLAADLCQGLVQDRSPHPMSALAKPAVGQTVVDPEFGTTIRRITAVAPGPPSPAIVPMYSTVPAWNADESRLILYRVGAGHELYDGRTYQFIRALDIAPADLEQVYWHTSDPDLLFYVDGTRLVRYHVGSGFKETVRTFEFCTGPANSGNDPMFTSWDSKMIGLRCGGKLFTYRIDTDTVPSVLTSNLNAPQASASGTMAFLAGTVVDPALDLLRRLDLGNPYEHASLGRLASGHDTYNGVAFDPGPNGSGVGSLVTFDMTNGSSRVVVGPDTGFPYPPSTTHVSAIAYRQPGWVSLSIVGDPAGQGVLDNELVVADTNSGTVCRVGHHRSWGKNNTELDNSYWAEPHVVASPSGTRLLFASDWGNGSTVDSYVVELPSFRPLEIALSTDKPAYVPGQRVHASLDLTNAGVPATADFYLLVVLPDGDTVADFIDPQFHWIMGRLSAPASLVPIQAGVDLNRPYVVHRPDFLGWTWKGTEPAGPYSLVLMAVKPGAFADGRIDPGDVLASGSAEFRFNP